MKSKSLKEKFKNNIFVKPLYKKNSKKVKPKNFLISINVDNSYKLGGDDFKVKRQLVSDFNGDTITVVNTRKVDVLPGVCDKIRHHNNEKVNCITVANSVLRNSKLTKKMLENAKSEILRDSFVTNSKTDKLAQTEKNIPASWLRVIPLQMLPNEPVYSILFRCIVCQLGLATVLILWTIIWVFVINSFEDPYELKVAIDFEKEQNQLVIDLATELRQVTPVSPKWREAIEKRIEQERHLTFLAVSKGARIHPGQFWDLSGTFLFTVYVMTALGFGAPVPHTLWGRNAAIIYAFLAVPTHLYLMVNTSTCLIIKLEQNCCRRRKTQRVTAGAERSTTSGNKTESPACGRNSKWIKTSANLNLRKNLLRLLCVPCACRCVPLAAILYYGCGAFAFGVLRNRQLIDIFMFPLEFTTSGGLERVEGSVRILYGFYVEGAMVLLTCALTTLRRHCTSGANVFAQKYRLFQIDRP